MQTTPGTSLNDTGDSRATPSSDAKRPTTRRSGIRVGALVAVVALALDQASKWWAESRLDDGQPRELVGDLLQLRLTYNPGAAFSVGTGYTIVLTCIALTVIAVVIAMAGRIRSRAWAVALGLLLGGALGNVTDRLFRPPAPFRGHVVDFIELPHWPVFNVADSAISVAAVLFIALSLLGIGLDGSRARGTDESLAQDEGDSDDEVAPTTDDASTAAQAESGDRPRDP